MFTMGTSAEGEVGDIDKVTGTTEQMQEQITFDITRVLMRERALTVHNIFFRLMWFQFGFTSSPCG